MFYKTFRGSRLVIMNDLGCVSIDSGINVPGINVHFRFKILVVSVLKRCLFPSTRVCLKRLKRLQYFSCNTRNNVIAVGTFLNFPKAKSVIVFY